MWGEIQYTFAVEILFFTITLLKRFFLFTRTNSKCLILTLQFLQVESVSKFLIPALFIAFNLCYWPVCLVAYVDDK